MGTLKWVFDYIRVKEGVIGVNWGWKSILKLKRALFECPKAHLSWRKLNLSDLMVQWHIRVKEGVIGVTWGWKDKLEWKRTLFEWFECPKIDLSSKELDLNDSRMHKHIWMKEDFTWMIWGWNAHKSCKKPDLRVQVAYLRSRRLIWVQEDLI